MSPSLISVSQVKSNPVQPSSARPAHHDDDSKSLFKNPWPSFRPINRIEIFRTLKPWSFPSIPKDISTLIPVRKPDFAASEATSGDIKATWLGHASFLVEFPHPGRERGIRVLFDPVFSYRCSPVSFMGPARFTPTPCKVEELPDIDAIVISHNHYDHMDITTLKYLVKRPNKPHIFAPLNNDSFFSSNGIPSSHFHCLDWWDSCVISVSDSSSENKHSESRVRLTCTPAQHVTNRGLSDRFQTLWSSWAVEELGGGGDEIGAKVWFAGDTGYRTVRDGEAENTVPSCPAFKEIGDRFGGFDLAMIPIGAYAPRHVFSNVHASPSDSVQIFKDVKASRALAMHWGTFVLTLEDVMEPAKLLQETCKRENIPNGAFTTSDLGETVHVAPRHLAAGH